MHCAAEQGNLAEVQSLIKTHARYITRTNTIGNTPLHLAAANGHIGVVQCLVETKEGKKTLNTKNKLNQTACQMAGHNKHSDVAGCLVTAAMQKLTVQPTSSSKKGHAGHKRRK